MTRKLKEMPHRLSRRSFSATAGAAYGLSSLGRRGRAQEITDVLIVGAGLSELNAALTLEELGFRVRLVEARNRVGGRVYTLSDRPEMPETGGGGGGGSEVGPMYARIQTMIERLDLSMQWWQIERLEFMLHIGGHGLSSTEWESSSANPLAGQLRRLPPFALNLAFMPRDTGLPELDSWLESEHHGRDISLHEHYVMQGADRSALRFLRLAAQADDLRAESYLWNLRKARVSQFELNGSPFEMVVGGMSRVPQGMASLVNGDIQIDTPVAALSQDNAGVTATTETGEVLRAKYAIVTVPLPVLRTMSLDPPLPPLQAEAVKAIPYGQATSVFLQVREPFWEVDGLGSSLWSDGPIGRAYNWLTPNGNYIWVFLAGIVNHAIRTWDDEAVMDFVLRELAVTRPSTVGRVKPIAVRNWSNDPFARGTYSYRTPGQIARYGNVVAEPHGRIHFAGEHTALLQQGMEGAMESGERAVFEIFDRA